MAFAIYRLCVARRGKKAASVFDMDGSSTIFFELYFMFASL
jgi:hypothetical protein